MNKWIRVALVGVLGGLTTSACSEPEAGKPSSQTACDIGQTSCGNACVELSSNSLNCGGCGLACSAGRSCVAGSCTCTAAMTDCAGSCVSLMGDAANCGTCSNACQAGLVCSLGQCSDTCAATLTRCGSSCIDINTDAANCGACRNVCPGGTCSLGQCSGGVSGSGGATTSGGTAIGGSSGLGGATAVGGAGGTTGGGQGGSGGAGVGGATSTGGVGGASGSGTGGSTQMECDTSWDDASKGDGIALTPPMGWNSWNAFHENINETQIREVADAMVSTGLRDAGYVFLNLDDKWMDDDGRDGQGNLVADSARFPSGMASLADYVHNLGLKFGVYGDRGNETCANQGTGRQSGSYGHETQDAQTFASWGVDYLKYDNCEIAAGRDSDQAQQEDYQAMSNALSATGRPIVFSICAWDAKPWMPNVGHLWRSTFDIGPCFSGCNEWYRNIDQIIDENNETPDWAGPGHWNDPDMMVVGQSPLTHDENVSHFSLWAVMAAPIILGNDIRSMSNEIRDILINDEVIAVNQDPAGIQGTRVADNGDLEVWMKPLCSHDGPEKAVVLLNRGGGTSDISVSFTDIGISGSATVRDLWSHEELGEFTGSFSAQVPTHGVVMVKVVQTGN